MPDYGQLFDAETGARIGPATGEQSDWAKSRSYQDSFLIDANGHPINDYGATLDETPKPVRRVTVVGGRSPEQRGDFIGYAIIAAIIIIAMVVVFANNGDDCPPDPTAACGPPDNGPYNP
jgi:hypothetical protein